jgi:hypothetical protein
MFTYPLQESTLRVGSMKTLSYFLQLRYISVGAVKVGRFSVLLCFFCLGMIAPLSAQALPDSASKVSPYVPEHPVSMISPDNVWTLRSGCETCSAGRALWLISNADHHRRLVRRYDGSLRVGWSPDGNKFFLNEEEQDGKASSYVVDPASLKVIELSKIIRTADASSAKYLDSSHSCVSARDWLTADTLVVELTGHLDQPPIDQFELQFQVHLTGDVTRVSTRQWPLFSGSPAK